MCSPGWGKVEGGGGRKGVDVGEGEGGGDEGGERERLTWKKC